MNYSHYSRIQRELEMHNNVVRRNIKAPPEESWKKMYDVTDRTYFLPRTPSVMTPARQSMEAMYRYEKNMPPAIAESCMTGHYNKDFDNHILQLMSTFPQTPITHLTYWYNKYKGDLHHTIEFLLNVKEKVTALTAEDINATSREMSNVYLGIKSDFNDASRSGSNKNEAKKRKNRRKKRMSVEPDHEEVKVEVAKDEIVELNLGANFVTQLETCFGDPNLPYPQGIQPVVQVPRSLARQLYASYVDSVYQQLESQNHVLEMENEEFARKLKRDQYQHREQAARNVNPATVLTRQMLFDAFPTIAQDVLLEVLYAHNDSYKETVETLLATTGYKNVNDSIVQVEGAPIREDVLHEMKVAQQINGGQEYGDRQDASFHRAEAKKYFEKRCELFDMAQQYHRHGLTEAAQFFFGLSNLQSEYLVRANAMAVTAILNEHSRRLQDFNTLDLHFLYVKEAISALDVFLDRNISLLKLSQQRTHEYLQIITGRGNRSENGICKIKPAVKARLKERNIDCVELNPGRLKVRITKGSKVASELSKT